MRQGRIHFQAIIVSATLGRRAFACKLDNGLFVAVGIGALNFAQQFRNLYNRDPRNKEENGQMTIEDVVNKAIQLKMPFRFEYCIDRHDGIERAAVRFANAQA